MKEKFSGKAEQEKIIKKLPGFSSMSREEIFFAWEFEEEFDAETQMDIFTGMLSDAGFPEYAMDISEDYHDCEEDGGAEVYWLLTLSFDLRENTPETIIGFFKSGL